MEPESSFAVRASEVTQSGSSTQPLAPVVNGINGGVNGINGHSRTISDSTSFDEEEFDIDVNDGRGMDLSFEETSLPRSTAQPPAEVGVPSNRVPTFAERDAQSARASGLIGNMLLRGFSLLADSCPNSTCYGIPLVGHPRARRAGGRDAGLEDMKKECVICHRIYNKDGALLQGGSTERVDVPAPVAPVSTPHVPAATTDGDPQPDSPRTLARRALYAEGEKKQTQVKNGDAQLDLASATRSQPSQTNVATGIKSSKVSVGISLMLLSTTSLI